jgi:antitoxin component HigA of HigAB toxin-antitoxin module
MNMKRTIDVLKENPGGTENTWRKEAEYRRANASWLRLSQMIALLARARMAELNVTQQELAERISCSQQNISILLSGKANLTLDTIARLEEALQFDLISKGLESKID